MSGDLGQFGAREAAWSADGDPELARAILAEAQAQGLPAVERAEVDRAAGQADHGLLVPILFLDPEGRWPIVEVSLSFLPYDAHRALGSAISRTAGALGRRVAFVASGDLSHRLTPDAPAGYDPRAVDFDAEVRRLVASGDLSGLADIDPSLTEAAGECGLRSFVMLDGCLGESATSRLLSYEGPWGVGYLTAVAGEASLLDSLARKGSGSKGGTPGADESVHAALARRAIEEYLRSGRVIDPPSEPPFDEPSAAFVSLHRGPDLRGCIGSILPGADTLGEEIVTMAIQAATKDPRFPPLTVDELDDLEISVDVLSAPESVDGIEHLDPSVYGVIVTSGFRRGLLLPDLDGVDDARTQVDIARRKAGIGPNEPVSLERFRVERFH
jgi:AmmeMemoRadiSam system protein A